MKENIIKGFTLIEILGVVILIGILALIIFPFAERSLQSGKDKALIQMQESIILAAKIGQQIIKVNYQAMVIL